MRDPRPTTARSPDRSGDALARTDGGGAPSPDVHRDLAALRAAVAHHVGDRRAAGVPLERVLADMCRLVEAAELLEASPDELGVLMGQVRRWSLEAYLDEPERRGAPHRR